MSNVSNMSKEILDSMTDILYTISMEQTSKPKRALEPRLTIRITPQTHKALKQRALDESTSVQALLSPVIESVAFPHT